MKKNEIINFMDIYAKNQYFTNYNVCVSIDFFVKCKLCNKHAGCMSGVNHSPNYLRQQYYQLPFFYYYGFNKIIRFSFNAFQQFFFVYIN